MPRRASHTPPLPLLAAELTLASWEVIARRGLLMAQNRCSAREYRRMGLEKLTAAQLSAAAFIASGGTAGAAALLAPWHRRAKANARRLRRK